MIEDAESTLSISSILSPLPAAQRDEVVTTLLTAKGARLERIVSHGQVSPEGYWYDQAEAEWVLVVTGHARVTIEGERHDRALGPGDSLFLPAHCRHRVAWTDPECPTVWLALFVDMGLAPVAKALPGSPQ